MAVGDDFDAYLGDFGKTDAVPAAPAPAKTATQRQTERIAAHRTHRAAPMNAAFDAYLAEDTPAALPPFDPHAPAVGVPASLARPGSPEDTVLQERQKRIDKGMLPVPSRWDAVKAAIDPSETSADTAAFMRKIGDRLSFGLEPKIAEKLGSTSLGRRLGFPPPGTYAKTEADRPLASEIAEVPAAALGMISGPAELAGMAGRGLAETTGLAASRAPQAIKTAVEAAAGGGLYGAADTALRGGSPGDVARDALVSGSIGAAAGLAPAAAGAVEDFAHQRALSSAIKPLKETAKKMQGKALTQFGQGEGKEAGAKELRDFIDREGLQPVIRSGPDMESGFEARKQGVWQQDIEPVYAKAFETNPHASVPMREIESAIDGVIPPEMRGTSYSRKVQQVLEHIKAGAKDIPGKNAALNYPLKNFYENVKEIQQSGYSGVVNYDTPTQAKEVARDVGGALRKLFNDRVGRIYAANPKAAQELMGQSGSGFLSPTGKTIPKDIPDAILNDPDVRAVGERLQAGNKRFSDYAKLSPVVLDAAERASQNRKWLPTMIQHLGGGGVAALGGAALAPHLGLNMAEGGLTGALASEAIQRGLPLAARATEKVAGAFAGPAVNPVAPMRLTEPLTRTDIARLLGSPVGIAALKDYIRKRRPTP